jgi:hypothetical protein
MFRVSSVSAVWAAAWTAAARKIMTMSKTVFLCIPSVSFGQHTAFVHVKRGAKLASFGAILDGLSPYGCIVTS